MHHLGRMFTGTRTTTTTTTMTGDLWPTQVPILYTLPTLQYVVWSIAFYVMELKYHWKSYDKLLLIAEREASKFTTANSCSLIGFYKPRPLKVKVKVKFLTSIILY